MWFDETSYDASIVRRLLQKATKDVDCMICHYAPSKVGYPKVSKDTYAHRIVCSVVHGPIEDGKYVMHSCDNRRCINPEHLSAGWPFENVHDMLSKGRAGKVGGCKPRLFTEKDRKDMLNLVEEGWSQREIAAKFETNQTVIWRYVNGL